MAFERRVAVCDSSGRFCAPTYADKIHPLAALLVLLLQVRVFRKCVGNQNPLTHGALGSLGKVKLAQGKHSDALVLLTEALEGEASKDAFQIDDSFMLLNSIKTILIEHPDAAKHVAASKGGKPPRGGGGGGGGGKMSGFAATFKPYVFETSEQRRKHIPHPTVDSCQCANGQHCVSGLFRQVPPSL